MPYQYRWEFVFTHEYPNETETRNRVARILWRKLLSWKIAQHGPVEFAWQPHNSTLLLQTQLRKRLAVGIAEILGSHAIPGFPCYGLRCTVVSVEASGVSSSE